ncbi:RRP7 domain-containing protein [Trichostrongylus colubriformis]|uniref:RRP7 domain-containing protein n=1 Tax=Trichostrongylus colubriformis TaxID=6319 RepID=A0AAN8FEJ8_TRICO
MVKDNCLNEANLKHKGKRLKKMTKKALKEEVPSVQDSSTPSATTDEIRYLRYSVSERYPAPRQLFLKLDKSNEYSLIVGNVPAYLPKGFVEGFLKQFVQVPISEVIEQRSNALDGSLNHGQLTLSVRFEDPKGVTIALAQCQNAGPFRVCDFVDPEVPSVLQNSVALYRKLFPSAEEIQKSAMDFIQKQDEEMQEAKKAAKRKLTEPDDEGWITVTKAAKRVDIAFYSFDKKNTKTKKLNELREKFNQDKKRIALLKNSRKFKPD